MPTIAAPDDRTPDEIYLEVGRSLTQWEGLEFVMSQAFMDITMAQFIGASRAYGAIGTLWGRLDALKEAGDAYFEFHKHPLLQERFDALLALTRTLGTKRNNIAHGMVVMRNTEGYVLEPAWHSSKKVSVNWVRKYSYGSSDIAKIRDEFVQLNGRWGEFISDFRRETRASP